MTTPRPVLVKNCKLFTPLLHYNPWGKHLLIFLSCLFATQPDQVMQTEFAKNSPFTLTHGSSASQTKQELSYRQQIARQPRTQYAEGIYRHEYYTVTLKSRLRVTQGHWKRNHWINDTRISSSRVI